ncbi:MAG: fibronectin type III domain-containing protein [Candidatus Cybelea sp.]
MGGTVLLRVGGNVDLTGTSVTVCFGWDDKNTNFVATPRIQSFDANTVVYSVVVPEALAQAPAGVKVEAPWVPRAKMRVVVSGGKVSPPIDVVLPIGITQQVSGIIAAVIVAMLALIFCSMVARGRGVRGTNVFLQIISTQSGYASLSQFQLILWTLVIGVGAVYVMVLSGNLLDITTGALVLLGISGGAIVASKIQSDQADKQGAAPAATDQGPPGQVQTLYSDAATDSEVMLRWLAPIDGPLATGYIVEYAVAPAAGADPLWLRDSEAVQQPRHTVMGLSPATQYTFRVTALNASGMGKPSDTLAITTAAVTPTPQGAPQATTGLCIAGDATISSAQLTWLATSGACNYVVQKRVHDSGKPWVQALAPKAASALISNLQAGTDYDFRVSAQNASGVGLPSEVVTIRTLRKPLWSDLVVTGDGAETIDVTRLQALLFTMIAAGFVSLRIYTGFTIPDIPDGFLILMGISNGVYIGAKFVNNGN